MGRRKRAKPSTLLSPTKTEQTDAARLDHALVEAGYRAALERAVAAGQGPAHYLDLQRATLRAWIEALEWLYVFTLIDDTAPMGTRQRGKPGARLRDDRRLIDALCHARAATVHGLHVPVRWTSKDCSAVFVDRLPPYDQRTPAAEAAYAQHLAGRQVELQLRKAARTLSACVKRRRKADRFHDAFVFVMAQTLPKLRLKAT